MSDRTKDIIQSPEAEAFLRMVTKDFYADSYTGLWIYEVIGREWDDIRGWTEGLVYETQPQTCTWSLPIWEWMYGITPTSDQSMEVRRLNLMAKIRATKPINPETIRRGIASLIGRDRSEVTVTDFVKPYTFKITITASQEEYRAAEMFRWVRETKPSHLSFTISVETKADIKGNIHTAAAVVSAPKLIITNSQAFDDLGLQGKENTGAATISHAKTIITNNQQTEVESKAKAKASAGTVTNQRLIITNHQSIESSGTAMARATTGTVTSQRIIIT